MLKSCETSHHPAGQSSDNMCVEYSIRTCSTLSALMIPSSTSRLFVLLIVALDMAMRPHCSAIAALTPTMVLSYRGVGVYGCGVAAVRCF